MRIFILVLFFIGALWAENPMVLQLTGVKTTHMMANGKAQEVFIERNTPKECNDVGINPEAIFSGDYAGKNVPPLCKKSFVTTVGKAQPMSFAQGVITVGEIEVLDFIKNKLNVNPSAYILVDARKRDWYEQMTIPSSVNIPFDEINMTRQSLRILNVYKRYWGFAKLERPTILVMLKLHYCFAMVFGVFSLV